jgi:hypothetical protein
LYLYPVKKAISIFFMCIYMLSFSELHQFLRIPVLVQHFVEHQKQNPDISLLAYLELHYVHQYLHDDDYQRDNQLPFRAADCCIITANALPSCECPYHETVDVTMTMIKTKNVFVIYDEDNHSLLSVADIFQPPRVA